jgi:hypothetical protein
MTIKILKLVTNETVLADVGVNASGQFILSEPVSIRMFPTQIAGGQPQLGFAPWPDFADMDNTVQVIVEPLHVAYHYTPNKDMADEYQKLLKDLESGTSQSGIITG